MRDRAATGGDGEALAPAAPRHSRFMTPKAGQARRQVGGRLKAEAGGRNVNSNGRAGRDKRRRRHYKQASRSVNSGGLFASVISAKRSFAGLAAREGGCRHAGDIAPIIRRRSFRGVSKRARFGKPSGRSDGDLLNQTLEPSILLQASAASCSAPSRLRSTRPDCSRRPQSAR